VQMITGTAIDWHQERRALIDMVTRYLQRSGGVGDDPPGVLQ